MTSESCRLGSTDVLEDGNGRPPAPSLVFATSDRATDVEVTWSAVEEAIAYKVFRCSSPCSSETSWAELTSEPVSALRFIDTSALGPGPGGAPTVQASEDRADAVRVSWSAVVSAAPRYRYRVTSVGASSESAPSSSVEGGRAGPSVIGYEVRIADGAWLSAGDATTTEWLDTDAPAPTVAAGAAAASSGTFAGWVRLSVTGAGSQPGLTRSYSVRAVTDQGPAEASAPASGRRVAGPIGYQWERSADDTPEAFEVLLGGTTATFDDTSAPSDGATRWYRVVVSAAGASDALTEPVAGARQGTPGVPAGVRATRDLADRVLVEWSAVSGAIGYHVYRDGARLTDATGVTATSFVDFGAAAPTADWDAPSEVVATTDDTSKVVVSWTTPVRPVGAEATYEVSAVNPADEGPLSLPATGYRAAPALTGYDVEVTPSGTNSTWISTGSTLTHWDHASAPEGTITPGTVGASQGEHRTHVVLGSNGATVSRGVDVAYRVRGVLQGGATTPPSASASGQRAVGPLVYRWQRSTGSTATGFTDLPGADAASFDDTTAPSDGSKRWYQLDLSAAGATSRIGGPVEGWRLAFVGVATGTRHTCALTSDGAVWCWGSNAFGQLGVGDTEPYAEPMRVLMPADGSRFQTLVAGAFHTCAKGLVGDVWCWGFNSTGQLGDGSLLDRTRPTRLTTLTTATGVGIGAYHSYAIVTGGLGRAWGFNDFGQLGTNDSQAASGVEVVLDAAGDPMTDILQLVGGYGHTCARRSARVTCWGAGTSGQLGNGQGTLSLLPVDVQGLAAVAEVAAGARHSCARLTDGTVRCWGSNDSGRLGDNSTTTRNAPVAVVDLAGAAQLALSASGSCARAGTTVYCWGHDASGQLGNGGVNAAALVPVQVVGLSAPSALGAGPNSDHVCAIDDFAVRCWGENADGQLGDGETEDQGSAVDVVLP